MGETWPSAAVRSLIALGLFGCLPASGGDDDPQRVFLDEGLAADASFTPQDARLADARADLRALDAAPDAAPTPPLEPRLRAHVEHLATTIGSRSSRTPEQLQAALDYLVAQLEDHGVVQREVFTGGGQIFTNLVFEVVGTERPEEVVVVGGHYDCVPTTPGADDNATGTAAALELALYFAARPAKRTLHFVFFSNEEPPFFQTESMGSLVHARALREADVNVITMFSLEMLGFYSDAPDSQELPLGLSGLFPTTGNFIAFVSDVESNEQLQAAYEAFSESGFPAERLPAPSNLREAGFSDHWSFWQLGYPGIMVTDTAFLRNPHYHEPTDTPATLDFPRYAQVVEGLAGMLEILANP